MSTDTVHSSPRQNWSSTTVSTSTSTRPATARVTGAPKSGEPTPPAARLTPLGSSPRPMTRMIVPVTTGGNGEAMRWMPSAIATWAAAVTSTPPRTASNPWSAAQLL
jgi:hypothetical protein